MWISQQRNAFTMDNDKTRKVPPGIYHKFPKQYYQYALKWCSYANWTIEETANLLTGCVPHRNMFLKGEGHKELDTEILHTENKVRGALGKELRVVKSHKYFGKTYIDSGNILEWAPHAGIVVPADLLKAHKEIPLQWEANGYATPCILAFEWVVKNYWEDANLREPPTAGEIIQALLQQFPVLTGAECDMVERITRHPLTPPD
ncbi:MAG TPA: hypothetical protein DCM54_02975 [Gammaproteobacteria bacterium]|nr:hypothetical protein [Gammaproteobacteria bacterium]